MIRSILKFMRNFSAAKSVLGGIAGAAGTGILLGLSAPPFGLDYLVWAAFIPLFLCAARFRMPAVFFLSLFSGALYYALAFQWTRAFHPLAVPVIAAGSSLFFFALPVLCMKPFFRRPVLLPAAIPSIWIVFEFIKQTWFLPFPFGTIGYTQFGRLRLIQIADLGGVALVSWVILFVNAAVFTSLLCFFPGEGKRAKLRPGIAWLLSAALCLISVNLYGTAALRSLRFKTEPSLKIGFAQTLFHPRREWTGHQAEYMETIQDLGKRFAGLGTDLILFPELTVDRALTLDGTIKLDSNAEIFNTLSSLADAGDAAVLFGSLELKRNGGAMDTFNSMYLFSKDGDLTGLYRKRLLVPFGETNPFPALFPSLSRYMKETTDAVELTRGNSDDLIGIQSAKGVPLRFGVLICFEGTVGGPARDYARKGADFLVNATNDYWSLSSVAMYQHAVMSIFRAVETRTPVLRISNGGFSCYVDERGSYASGLPVFQNGSMTSKLFLLENKPVTLYVRFGSWLIGLCALAVLASLILLLKREKN